MFSAATKTDGSTTANYIEDVFSTYIYTGNGSTQAIVNNISLGSTNAQSVVFDGTGDILKTPDSSVTQYNLTGDFTIELWFYGTTVNPPSAQMLLNRAGGLNIAFASYEIIIGPSGGNTVHFAASSANTSYDIGGENATGLIGSYTPNQWNHVAVTRSGNIYRGFLNGVQGYTQTLALTPYTPTTRGIVIGASYQNSWNVVGNIYVGFVGNISNVRIIKGTALYTSNFSVPTSPLTAISETSLLTCQGNTADYSSFAVSTSVSGNVAADSLSPFSTVSGSGGMVWMKSRSAATDHALYDTARGATFDLASNLTAGQTTQSTGLTAFNTNGFSVGSLTKINNNNALYASWTFREQPKFFDVVTYTGTGANRTVAHNLGSVPGCIIVKRTDTTGDWQVYHRSLANTEYMVLNTVAAKATGATRWNSTTPTSTEFSLGTDTTVNANNGTYVAYLFAHDAGGFGAAGTDNVITCGSYTGNGSTTGPVINLGYEPQFILLKNSNVATSDAFWFMFDTMRGITTGGNDFYLGAQTSAAEGGGFDVLSVNATGFSINFNDSNINGNGNTIIYIAIRRGPMKVPTSGTSVFQPVVYTGTNVDNRLVNTTILADMVLARQRNSTTVGGMVVGDRLRGNQYFVTGTTAAGVTDADSLMTPTVGDGNSFSAMNGFGVGNDATSQLNQSTVASNQVVETFQRAPGFMDVVCYTGTGANTTVTHNLGVAPELMIVKCRSAANDWAVYANNDNTDYLLLNSNAATADDNTYWNDTSPTASVFSVGTNADVNTNTATYVAYLFATVAGVSKVGSYTGTGTTQTINCGFTAGSRFVMIKRTDTTGDWYVWDSARGIVAGNDPYLLLNSTAAEVTNTDYVDTANSGFEISSTAPAAINANGGTFIFLAIA